MAADDVTCATASAVSTAATAAIAAATVVSRNGSEAGSATGTTRAPSRGAVWRYPWYGTTTQLKGAWSYAHCAKTSASSAQIVSAFGTPLCRRNVDATA